MRKSWSSVFHDAVFEAHWRAMVSGWRYRVTFDRANRLWNLTATADRVPGWGSS